MKRRIVAIQSKFLDQVVAIERGSFLDPWPASSFSAEIEHEWSLFKLIGMVDFMNNIKKVEGFVICWILSDQMHLLSLAVDKNFRRQGLASRLLTHAIEVFAEKGGGVISLEVRESNTAAQAFYFSKGFEVVGERPRYYRHGDENALVMNLMIESSSRRPVINTLNVSGR